jgi:hypothetical protein
LWFLPYRDSLTPGRLLGGSLDVTSFRHLFYDDAP